MKSTTVVVDLLQPHEIGEAARLISLSLLDTPNAQAFWGGQGEIQRRRLERATRLVNLQHPQAVNLAVRLGDQLVGALCMIHSPACQLTTWQALKLLPQLGGAAWVNFRRGIELQKIGARLDPPQTHWHLGPVGIAPTLQGRGLGSQIFEAMCRFLDEKGEAGYLETDRMWIVHSLEGYGFVTIGKAEILGVQNWRLWRAAH
jgi:GNAT superfamily N-acetyltransferase